MRKFCLKLLIVLIPVAIFSITIEILLRHIPNDYQLKREYLDVHCNEVEILVLGSSHAFRGINPDCLSGRAFNSSLISQTYDYDYAILKKYGDDWSDLKTVVLPLSYPSLFVTLAESDEPWRIKNYTIYFNLKASNKLKDYTEILSNNGSVIKQRLELHYIQGRSNITSNALGWGEIYLANQPVDLERAGKAAAERHTKEGLPLFDLNLGLLESIIEFCGERGVEVLLFTPPAYRSYRQELNEEQLELTVRTGRELAARFSNCSYIDLLSDTSFVSSDYFDSDHMNAEGADKLSQKIDQLIHQ